MRRPYKKNGRARSLVEYGPVGDMVVCLWTFLGLAITGLVGTTNSRAEIGQGASPLIWKAARERRALHVKDNDRCNVKS
jgi:hypothetical protein